jgi:hypothetical protein
MVSCRRAIRWKTLISGYFTARYSPLEKTLHKTGIVRDGLMMTTVALIAMTAKRFCAAARNGVEYLDLWIGQGSTIAI